MAENSQGYCHNLSSVGQMILQQLQQTYVNFYIAKAALTKDSNESQIV